MTIRGTFHAIARGRGLTAVAVLGAFAVAGLGSSCGGRSALSRLDAGDVGQGTGGQAGVTRGNSQLGGTSLTGGSTGTGGSPGTGGSVGTGGSSGTGGSLGGIVTCTFGGLLVDKETLSRYTESGITVVATAGNWQARTSLGKPAPAILFMTPAGVSATGRVEVTAGGSAFHFVSVDLYSSISSIPYVCTGLLGSTEVFSVSGTVPNPLGTFATVTNPNVGDLIDTLYIELANGTACCESPMGLDNIRLRM
jgi:hypothetical protein